MLEYIELGSSPAGEECAQVGSANYHELSILELRHFKRMMDKLHPPVLPENYYKAKTFITGGGYSELVAYYNTRNEESAEWAFQAEVKTPEDWDLEALKALVKYYPQYAKRIEELEVGGDK